MKHVSLYRKWRPRSMAQIVGQEPIVRTLQRAIDTGRVAHAYLFSGPRGTGKTSTAKVLAMGLNCRNSDGPTSEPCGECESCRAIASGSSMDVLEMDAASNRGIDEIRELRDRVSLAPSSGRFKVYIIDEVHMLTTEAFNALLKMLEEPPEHVIFVLATTEKHRVLSTIISRCQSFDFRRPGVQVLADKLAEIAAAEGMDAEPEALTTIARAGGGSFRDAEGLLDQLASFSEGKITAAMVRDMLGSAGTEVLAEATEALHERRSADALRLIDRLAGEGRDLGQFTGELLEHLRRVMLFPHAPEVALAEVGEAGEERERLQRQAENIPTAEVVRFVDVLGDSLGRAKRGGDPKLELELTFLRLTRDYAEPSVEPLMARIEALENALANGAAPSGAIASGEPASDEASSAQATASASQAAQPSHAPETTPSSDNEAASVRETEDPEPETTHEEFFGEAAEEQGEAGESDATDQEEAKQSPEAASESKAGSTPGAEQVSAQWSAMMQELKRNRQALTAAVYEEARVQEFDGAVLKLAFPEEQSFYVGMANERKHADELGKVLQARLGERPRLEIGVYEGGEPPFQSREPASAPPEPEQSEPQPPAAPEPRRDEPEGHEEDTPQPRPSASAGVDSPGSITGAAAGGGNSDDIIRDPREVVEMARQRFGSSGRDRGGGS